MYTANGENADSHQFETVYLKGKPTEGVTVLPAAGDTIVPEYGLCHMALSRLGSTIAETTVASRTTVVAMNARIVNEGECANERG